MIITLNGKPKETRPGTTVADIIQRMDGDISAAAIALNNTFLPQEQHATTELKNGDVVEVVTPHPGG